MQSAAAPQALETKGYSPGDKRSEPWAKVLEALEKNRSSLGEKPLKPREETFTKKELVLPLLVEINDA